MDEITIDGKTYISSKQAAGITGYAKDYVGQLCREGRVEARLIGRSWYVLEESIRKHRFEEAEPTETKQETVSEESEKTNVEAIWTPTVYTPEDVHMLPAVKEQEAPPEEIAVLAEAVEEREPVVEVEESPVEEPMQEVIDKNLQENWESWFTEEPKAPKQEIKTEEEAGTPVAVHVMEDIQPVKSVVAPRREEVASQERAPRRGAPHRPKNQLIYKALSVAVALIFVSIAVIGTGLPERFGKTNSWPIVNFLGGASYIK